MTPLKQPHNSKLCGHTCIAMLADISVERVVELIGHKRGTKTREVVATFRQLGFECPDRLVVLRDLRKGRLGMYAELEMSMVKITFPGLSSWHWVVVHQGQMYDPSPARAADYGRPTSHLPLTRVG